MNTCAEEAPVVSHPARSATRLDKLVLVAANGPGDGMMVSALLKRAGYHSEVRFISSIYSCSTDSESLTSERYAASVLCYRTRESDRHGFRLPMPLSGQRIIVLSDCDNEQIVVSMLNGGAHHVIDLRQSGLLLQVRMEAALHQRRRNACTSLALGDIYFDVSNLRVRRAGKQIDLSPKEFQLAYYLFLNLGRIVRDRELMTSVWSLPTGLDTRRINTAASRLRKKLRLSAQHGWELRRLRNIGFQLVSFDIDK